VEIFRDFEAEVENFPFFRSQFPVPGEKSRRNMMNFLHAHRIPFLVRLLQKLSAHIS